MSLGDSYFVTQYQEDLFLVFFFVIDYAVMCLKHIFWYQKSLDENDPGPPMDSASGKLYSRFSTRVSKNAGGHRPSTFLRNTWFNLDTTETISIRIENKV